MQHSDNVGLLLRRNFTRYTLYISLVHKIYIVRWYGDLTLLKLIEQIQIKESNKVYYMHSSNYFDGLKQHSTTLVLTIFMPML